jgi:hypothetical protein
MSEDETGRGSGNTTTGNDVTMVDDMPIEVQQEVYVLPAASHRMARVVQQELPTGRGESPPIIQRQDSPIEGPMLEGLTPNMARVVGGERGSGSRSRTRALPKMARVIKRSTRSRSISKSRIRDELETARVISKSRSRSRSSSRIRDEPEMFRAVGRIRSRSRSRQRGKRNCMRFRTRRRGMARVVEGVTAPGSGEKDSELYGYREYSSLLATDSDFLVFKRFGASNARVLLALQDDVMRKERALADVENALRQSNGPEKEKIHIAKFDDQADNAVWKLHESLDRYSLFFLCGWLHSFWGLSDLSADKFLIQVAEIGKWPKADKVNIESLTNWHTYHPDAIKREETLYLLHTADLFRLLPRNAEPLRKFLERWDRFTFFSLWRKEPNLDNPVADRREVLYMEDEKIDNFVLFVTVVIWLAMLIVPLWVLYFVHHAVDRLAIITAFIVVFLAVMALVTDAKPSEMLAATAG